MWVLYVLTQGPVLYDRTPPTLRKNALLPLVQGGRLYHHRSRLGDSSELSTTVWPLFWHDVALGLPCTWGGVRRLLHKEPIPGPEDYPQESVTKHTTPRRGQSQGIKYRSGTNIVTRPSLPRKTQVSPCYYVGGTFADSVYLDNPLGGPLCLVVPGIALPFLTRLGSPVFAFRPWTLAGIHMP